MTSLDVLVVGAGPAGSVAALVLARAGVRVGLLDRAVFPRDKLCGDTLNPGTLAILERLRLGTAVRDCALSVTGMDVTGPTAAQVSADYPREIRGAAISRRVLDLLLVEAAARAGARFDSGVLVRAPLHADTENRVIGVRAAVGRTEHSFGARVVIAADGRVSRLARAMGLTRFAPGPKRWAFGAYFSDVTGVGTHGEMHIRSDGYIGVAPLPDGRVNVCVVSHLGGALRRREPGTEDAVTAVVRGDLMLRHRFANARRLSEVAVLGPLAVDAVGAGCPGLLLAGDAAGFVDPMTGDGLRFALRGGELAAEAALDELSSGSAAHARLWSARAREFGSKWRLNRGLRALVDSPHAVDLAARVSRRWKAPVQLLVRLAGDVNLVRDGV